HWWEPLKSSDTALSADFQKIKCLGFNTVCVDHEVSQAIDNDWGWISREYKLAGEQKVSILPWLQLQGADRKALIEFSHIQIKPAVNQDQKEEDDYVRFLDPDFRQALTLYISVYLDRYINDPSILKVRVDGKLRPVVGLMLEAGWHNGNGQPLSFDAQSNKYFRDWMRSSHHDLAQLNKQWGTRYKSFDEIDPCDKSIFNYDFADKSNMPVAVREHANVRASAINDTLRHIARKVRERHKDVLFVAEVAYPIGSDNSDAATYRWNAASEYKTVEAADIVFVRTMGDTVTGEAKNQQEFMLGKGKQVVTAYRLMNGASPRKAAAFALDGAIMGNGLAYYNWNEHADRASAISDNPEKQAQIKSMNEMYDLLCSPEQRHLLNAPVPAAETPQGIPALVPPAAVQPPAEPVATPTVETTPAIPALPAVPDSGTTPPADTQAAPAPVTTVAPAAPAQ
ncbi:MAG TPA: hypothetical protein VGK34_10310, partial [Armatimonadota bacterium]